MSEKNEFRLESEQIEPAAQTRRWTRPQGGHRVTYISLGAGVESSALYVLATRRDPRVPRADVAIFADTGDERRAVYEQLARLKAFGKKHDGPPIRTVRPAKRLSTLMKTHYIPIPAFTRISGKTGMLRRECTVEAKIKPIHEYVRRKLLGLAHNERAGPDRRALCLKGFSVSEVYRVKPSQEVWLDIGHPLIDAGLRRHECRTICEREGLGSFVKSACVYCPYHGDREWERLRREDPEGWELACEVDEQIRHTAQRNTVYEYVREDGTQVSRRIDVDGGHQRNGVNAEALYLHRSCIPLREVDFADHPEMFGNECEGHCGV